MAKPVWASNKGAIGDGFRQCKVTDGGTRFWIMADTKTGKYTEVLLLADPINQPPAGGDIKLTYEVPV